MGAIVSSVGHLCIDLSHVELSGDDQRALLQTVQAAVVGHLARVASKYKVITISLSQNNGQRQEDEDERPPRDAPPGPDSPPSPDTPPRDAPPTRPTEH